MFLRKNNHFHDHLNNVTLVNNALRKTNKEWRSILHSTMNFLEEEVDVVLRSQEPEKRPKESGKSHSLHN